MDIISVIIPVYNREDLIGTVLEAVLAAADGAGPLETDGAAPLLPLAGCDAAAFEVIVVDDCSNDATCEVIGRHPVRLLCTPGNSGPSLARNLGVECARGEILVFVDSDVVVRPDTLARILRTLRRRPRIGGVAGISAEECPYDNHLSVYQNHFLRYRYLRMPELIDTPWASLMAVRRDAFEAVGGFDPAMKTYEDYDLGYRLGSVDAWFYLDRELDFVHYKEFRFRRLFADYLRKVANMFSYHLRMRFGGRKIWERRRPKTWHGNEPHFPKLAVGVPSTAVMNYLLTGPLLINLIPALALGGVYLWISLGLLLLPPLLLSGFWSYLLRREGFWFTLRGISTQLVLSITAEVGVAVSLMRAIFGKTSSDFLGASK